MKTLDRWLTRYLQRRGRIVFWLDGCARHCGPVDQPAPRYCWFEVYEPGHPAAVDDHE